MRERGWENINRDIDAMMTIARHRFATYRGISLCVQAPMVASRRRRHGVAKTNVALRAASFPAAAALGDGRRRGGERACASRADPTTKPTNVTDDDRPSSSPGGVGKRAELAAEWWARPSMYIMARRSSTHGIRHATKIESATTEKRLGEAK